jgi:signal transduction histidine kinase
MTLRVRLASVFTLAMVLVLIGTGATLFLFLRADLREDFQEDLERLAAAYAERVVNTAQLNLQPLPKSPVPEEIEDPKVFLFDANGAMLDALDSSEPPIVPTEMLTRVRAGNTAAFDLASPELRPLWLVAFSPEPLPLERRAALHPILSDGNGLQAKYFVLVSANDRGLVRVLDRVRNGIALWGVVGALVALGVGLLLSAYVTRPFRQIAVTAQAVSDGALSSRIPHDAGRDEIARLKRQLNAMLEQLEALVESQRRFTADAAHDLRTPLAVMRGELEITLRKPRSAENYRDTLERLLQEVKRFSALAEDLLLLSRLEAGVETPLKRLHLAQALEPTLTAHSVAARQSGVNFNAHVPPKLEVDGDSVSLARAVGNLLSNALTHGVRAAPAAVGASASVDLEPTGEIGLEARREGDVVQIRVFDSGAGIPEPRREGLFARFRKGEDSSGSGLGLAIVAQVARQHGGRVYYEARAGVGAVFVLELPAPTVDPAGKTRP